MPTLIAIGLAAAVLAALWFTFALNREIGRENVVVDASHTVLPRTVETAHSVMQCHRDCDLEWCPAKWGAYWLLADHGHLTPTAQLLRRRETVVVR